MSVEFKTLSQSKVQFLRIMSALNQCTICRKFFCCSSHRVDHEVKNHSETYPKLKQEFLVQLFQKRAESILIKAQNRRACTEVSDLKETDVNSENNDKLKSYNTILRNPRKRTRGEIKRHIYSKTVSVSETRKILVPVQKSSGNYNFSAKNEFVNCKPQIHLVPQNDTPSDEQVVKTSTPIIDNISKEETPTSNWNYASPASSISFYETPNMALDSQSEGRPLLRSYSTKATITPLRSIMTKSIKCVPDPSEADPSPNISSSKGRRVTFSFSSSRVSSANSSPLESVQEVEICEEIQDENREVITSVSSLKSLSEREVSTSVLAEKNYVYEVTSTINSCVKTSGLYDTNMSTAEQRFTEDSLVSVNGGLFSCVTSMFCSAVHTFPLWRSSRNRSKRSRSPERGIENPIVHSPRPKRPCYPTDLRLNPIRARKPISHN